MQTKLTIDLGIKQIMQIVTYYEQVCLEEDIDLRITDRADVTPKMREEIILTASRRISKNEDIDEIRNIILEQTIQEIAGGTNVYD